MNRKIQKAKLQIAFFGIQIHNPVSQIRSVLLLAVLVTATSGCVSLSSLLGKKNDSPYDLTALKAQGYSIPPGGMPRAVPESVVHDGTGIVLEIRGGDEPKIAAFPLPHDRALTVEDMAKRLELRDSLGACNLYIMRPNGSSPPLRLDVQLNSKGLATNPSHNYALRPGDHIIAIGDGRTLFERYVDEKLGR